MIILIKLLLAHFIADFLLQPQSWVKDKQTRKAKSLKLYLHAILQALLVIFILWDLNYWMLALLIMVLQGLIDGLTVYAQKENTKTRWFLMNQTAHIMVIFVLWLLIVEPGINFEAVFKSSGIWIYAGAILFITVVSSKVIRELMASWTGMVRDRNEESLNNAGKYIGMLERLFVFIFVITGHWDGIGFLLAAKSVFRFGDLKESKDRQLTEYILIGTLLSFGIAMAAGMVVLELLSIDV